MAKACFIIIHCDNKTTTEKALGKKGKSFNDIKSLS